MSDKFIYCPHGIDHAFITYTPPHFVTDMVTKNQKRFASYRLEKS